MTIYHLERRRRTRSVCLHISPVVLVRDIDILSPYYASARARGGREIAAVAWIIQNHHNTTSTTTVVAAAAAGGVVTAKGQAKARSLSLHGHITHYSACSE